jgi:hypothetical protein
MLILFTLVVLGVYAALAAVALTGVVDAVERRRYRRVATQIRVTDAVHRALGPIVAPIVVPHGRQPWTVTMSLAPRDFRMAGRLVELLERAMANEGGPVRVVFTPRAS